MAVGIAIGVAIGAGTDNIGAGIAVGVAIGAALEAQVSGKERRARRQTKTGEVRGRRNSVARRHPLDLGV